MAYAPRYIFNFLSCHKKDVVIRIDENGYEGQPLSRCIGPNAVLRMDTNNCIHGTSLELLAECVVEDEFADLYTSDPYKFYVTVTVDEEIIWRGFITPELYSAPWIDPPYDVTITATDGLGELKMHSFQKLGRQTLEAFLSTLLGATGLAMPLKFISTMASNVSDPEDLLAETSLSLDFMEGQSYYDVLQAILASLHATIRQHNGAWLLIRETDVEDSMISPGYVADTSGMDYAIEDFGSMASNNVWPIGRMSMEIVPAKRQVRVEAKNEYVDNLLTDPDMVSGLWSGTASHYSGDGSYYGLEVGQYIEQEVSMEDVVDAYNTNDLDLTIMARQGDNAGEHSVLVQILAQGVQPNTTIQRTVSLIESYNNPGYYTWANGSTNYASFELKAAVNNNASDCQEVTLHIPFRSLCNYYIVPPPYFKVKIYSNDSASTIYVHSAKLAASPAYEGITTVLSLNNNARGVASTVEPIFADTFWANAPGPFMYNCIYARSGSSLSLVKELYSDSIPYANPLPTGEFLAKDYALSVANPRLRLKGKLNQFHEDVSPFYTTQDIIFLTEEWTCDLLHDETEISLISLPASSLEVTSVKQSAWGNEGELAVSSIAVSPASFTIEAADNLSTYYIAINAAAGEAWTVEGIPAWLTFGETSGTGSETISFLTHTNSGPARSATLIIGGVPVYIYQAGVGTDYTLTISVTPSDATIALSVNGTSTAYTAGMLVASGATVAITVSKTGYGTQSETFTMPSASVEKVYTLSQSIEATITPEDANISKNAQNVSYTITDAANHGWILDYDGPDAFGLITGSGVTSGNASADTGYIRGTGNAVVYLTVQANGNAYTRTIANSPFYFQDETTNTKTYLSIVQLGVQDTPVPVTSVSLNKNSTTIAAGSSETLTATVSPSNATNKNLSWTSSNTSVAQVGQDGVVYGIAAGSTTVRASATDGSGKYATCTVTVTGGSTVSVTGVTLNRSTATIDTGGTVTLTATVAPTNATNKTVTWSSSNSSVATVSGGVVTGVSAGSATITVTTADGGYTATCAVTVSSNGSISADNVTVKSIATSGSTELHASNMQAATIAATCSTSWVTAVTPDTSGNPWRIRFTLNTNTSTTARYATVTVTGTDTSSNSRSCTFRITQNGKTSSDVPCTSMEIGGSATISNSTNEAEYTAAFFPNGTTQPQVGQWSVSDGNGHAVTTVQLLPSGNQCTIRVLSGANNQTVVLKATNYYNSSVYATKTITATYVTPSANLTVSPGDVTVHAIDTSDNTPTVTTSNIQSGSLGVQSVSGFITSASIVSGKVVTSFSANTGTSSRSGSVTLSALDLNLNQVTAVVTYTQAGTGTGTRSLSISKLNVQQTGGKVTAKFAVAYMNQSTNSTTFGSQSFTLVGYDSSDGTVFTKTGNLSDKTVAAMATETEIYTEQWTGTIGMSTHYLLTLYSAGMTVTYEGDRKSVV